MLPLYWRARTERCGERGAALEIGLTEEIRKMCGLPPLAAPSGDADPLFSWDLMRVDLAPSGYMADAGGVVFTKTHGRRAMGCMLDAARALSADRVDMAEKLQWREMEIIDCRLVSRCASRDGYGVPAERLAEELAAHLD